MLPTSRLTSSTVLLSNRASYRVRFCKATVLPHLAARSRLQSLQPFGSIVLDRLSSDQRQFHTTPSRQFKEIFPERDSPQIRITKPAWPHPVYTEEQMNSIVIAHRKAVTWSDWSALAAVRVLRWGLDLATGYRHDKEVAKGQRAAGEARQPFAMTERKYMIVSFQPCVERMS